MTPQELLKSDVSDKPDLRLSKRLNVHLRRCDLLNDLPGPEEEAVTPMWIGGTNGSHHSDDLRYLAQIHLVDSRIRGGWERGSRKYRLTPQGVERRDQLNGRTPPGDRSGS